MTMQTEKKKQAVKQELKNQLITKFTQVLNKLGFASNLFDKKLEKSANKLAKTIIKKKSKETAAKSPVKKSTLIKASSLKKTSKKPVLKTPPQVKKPIETKNSVVTTSKTNSDSKDSKKSNNTGPSRRKN